MDYGARHAYQEPGQKGSVYRHDWEGSRSGLQVASTKDILYSVIFFSLAWIWGFQLVRALGLSQAMLTPSSRAEAVHTAALGPPIVPQIAAE